MRYEIGTSITTTQPKYFASLKRWILADTPGTIVAHRGKGLLGLYENYAVEFNMKGETFTVVLAQGEIKPLTHETL